MSKPNPHFIKKGKIDMRFWIEFFMDKRFSLDFKIANLIMRDSLRNYLATDLILLQKIENERARKVEKDIKTLFDWRNEHEK